MVAILPRDRPSVSDDIRHEKRKWIDTTPKQNKINSEHYALFSKYTWEDVAQKVS